MGAGVFPITGDIDLANASALGAQLRSYAAETVGDVTLDCSAMTFIDSSGIKELVALFGVLRSQGRRLRMTGVRANCRTVLDVTGVSDLVGSEDDSGADDDSGEIEADTPAP
jgi:anti-anti-sigma factor